MTKFFDTSAAAFPPSKLGDKRARLIAKDDDFRRYRFAGGAVLAVPTRRLRIDLMTKGKRNPEPQISPPWCLQISTPLSRDEAARLLWDWLGRGYA